MGFPPYVMVWAPLIEARQEIEVDKVHKDYLRCYWNDRVAVVKDPAALVTDVKMCRVKELKTKKGNKALYRFQLVLGEEWDHEEMEAGNSNVDKTMRAVLAIMGKEKGVRKEGPAPRGPLEREAARLLDRMT